jgi:DNA-directed RNA polymerase subunit beta'
MNKLPVVACGLRPVTKLKDDDTIATTQINNLYRRVILINDRLKYYLDLNKNLGVFFSEIIHNEKRRLQKAIDQLIYGSSKQQPEIKSLLQSLSGKEGILRRYSLGKRVDYSARSVIVPNPNLLLNQIGVPVKMALVLFKPFIVQKLLKEKIVFTVREAENLISSKNPVIFSYLNEIIHNHPILANRAPSLHRLSLQGFFPKLTLGKAIELHPLITTALNADFDGDQIAIHLPLSKKSQDEARDNILSIHHTIDPKNGQLIDIPTQDIILGIYYLTKEEKSKSSFQYFEKISDI